MGKYSLGKSTTKVQDKIIKEGIYLNEVKADPYVRNILRELGNIDTLLQQTNITLNRIANIGVVKGNKAKTFKSWAKKSKSQGSSALKLKDKVSILYNKDVRDYPIKLLDDRIAELEKKIAMMSK